MMDFELVGRKALEVFSAEIGFKEAKKALFSAYERYKQEKHGGEHIEKDSEAWQDMRAACELEHKNFLRAKMDLRNAKTRLNIQIRRGLGDTSRIKS